MTSLRGLQPAAIPFPIIPSVMIRGFSRSHSLPQNDNTLFLSFELFDLITQERRVLKLEQLGGSVHLLGQ